MSDYTPTTEEVRKGYASALYLSEVPRDRSEEFDRWLAERNQETIAKGRRIERDYLIKWLEQDVADAHKWVEEHEGKFNEKDYVNNNAVIGHAETILNILKEYPIANDTN